jgi:UDPglucose 6-dehydrogenase
MTVLEINAEQVLASLSTVRDLIGDLSGKKVCVLGATFKPNTDDIRSSQSLLLVSALLESGAKVSLHDPIALSKVRLEHQNLYKEKELGQAFFDADIVVLATEWDYYLDVDPRAYFTSVKRPLILDLRGSLSQETWVKHGWEFARFGDHSSPNDVSADHPKSERT